MANELWLKDVSAGLTVVVRRNERRKPDGSIESMLAYALRIKADGGTHSDMPIDADAVRTLAALSALP